MKNKYTSDSFSELFRGLRVKKNESTSARYFTVKCNSQRSYLFNVITIRRNYISNLASKQSVSNFRKKKNVVNREMNI